MNKEINKLASFLLKNHPHEPGKERDESPVDVAIRLLQDKSKIITADQAYDRGFAKAKELLLSVINEFASNIYMDTKGRLQVKCDTTMSSLLELADSLIKNANPLIYPKVPDLTPNKEPV